MIILAASIVALGIYLLYRIYINFKDKNPIMAIIQLCLGAFLIFFGAVGVNVSQDNSSSSSSADTASSSSKSSSSSKDDNSSDESQNNDKKKAQQGVSDINKKISETPELAGLKVKLDKYDNNGENFDVEVPDTVLNGSASQQREIFKNIYTIIYHETGNQNPTVYYYDAAGNEIAQTKWDGSIKME